VTETVTSETGIKTGDYVEAYYRGSRYTGVVGAVSEKWQDAEVRFAKDVSMLLPLSSLTILKEVEEFDELDG
jgi:hypothetical protein